MEDQDKTKNELISELVALREHVDEKNKLQTELGDKEESLKVGEEKYRTLYENAPLSYQSLDVDGFYLDVNPAWQRTLGYDKEEVIGKNYADFLHPDWKTHFEKNFPEFKRVGYVHNVQFKIRHKDGHYIDISFEGCIGYYPDGKVKQTYCVFQDITDRKKIEQELKESKLKYKLLADYTYDWEYWIDPAGKYIYISPSVERITGYKIDEFYKNSEILFNMIREDYRDEISGHYKNENNIDEPVFKTVFPIITKSGKEVWISHTCSPVFDDSGTWIGRRGNNRDITTRKITEDLLKESEERYKNIVEHLFVGIAIHIENKIVFVNNSLTNMMGYDSDEQFLGRNVLEFVHLEDKEKVMNAISDAVNYKSSIIDKKSFIIEERLIKSDGSEIYVEASAIKISYQGNVALMVMINDITERKIAVNQLKESEEKFKEYTNQSSEGITVADLDGNYVYVNQAFRKMSGYSEKELLKLTVFDMKAENQPKTCFYESKEKMEGIPIRVNLKRKDGAEYLTEIIGKVIEVDKEKLVLGTIRDITEQNRAEIEKSEALEALKESEDHLSKIIFAANDGTWDWNLITNKVYFDPRYYQMAGYDVDEFPHKLEEFQKRNHPDDKEYVMGEVQKHLEGKSERFSVEFRFLKKDNSWLWILGRGSIVERDEHGTPIRFLGTHTDITERKLAEEQVKESEANLKSLIENRDDSIWSVDDSLCYIIFNNFFAKSYLMAYGIELHKGDKVIDLLSPELQDFWRSKYETVLAGEKNVFEFSNNFEGKVFYYQVSLNPIISDKKVTGVSAVSMDVTERKLAEERIEKSKLQLRELNLHAQNIREQERTDISREIHDSLGQALTALKMDLAWIQKKSEINDTEILSKFDGMKNLIDETTSSVQKISTELRPGLLDDLGLTYALDWQCREFEKRNEIKSTLKLKPKNIELSEKISVALFRIVQESLTNVVRHAKATEVVISLAKKKEIVELKITDNGIGINEENTENPKSLGLLGITERVYAINGEVSFLGKKEGGTEVKVIVPLENKDANK